jgi:hypothetical protein
MASFSVPYIGLQLARILDNHILCTWILHVDHTMEFSRVRSTGKMSHLLSTVDNLILHNTSLLQLLSYYHDTSLASKVDITSNF